MESEYLSTDQKQRLFILGDIFSMISRLDVVLISSVIDKVGYYKQYTEDDVEYRAWKNLFERCDKCIDDLCKNDADVDENGLIIVDHHTSPPHDEQIKNYLRVMRLYGSGFHHFEHVIEEPLFTPSKWRNVFSRR